MQMHLQLRVVGFLQYVIRRSEVCLHTCRSHHVTHDLPMHD